GNDARAYPIKILNYHEVVNDRVGGVPLAVTFCPLTQSVLVFLRSVAGQEVTFGVSGCLYKSNVLMYDHQTDSLWSQLRKQAVTGPMAGRRLETIAAMPMSWGHWKKRFPASQVLSDQTGFDRDYQIDPYAGYDRIWFPVGDVRRDLSPKTRVLGIESGTHTKAYPLEKIVTERGTVRDRMGGREIEITVSAEGDVTAVVASDGSPLVHVFVFWFAWQAFHPETEVYP
ncbi:MAG: DUF3179 domain-containing protein, partial [Desulfosarcina sp.]|nr:DUF3179 domain-containing protein [Desulfobacterales bacterium]